jgi:hypothetical protein
VSKPIKVFSWVIINISYYLLFYFALFVGIVWAGNIVMFLANIMFILTFLNVLVPDTRKNFKNIATMPAWVNISTTLIEAIIFAAFGWFYYAVITFLVVIFFVILYKGE